MTEWTPISNEALVSLVSEQLRSCSPQHRATFSRYRVPFYKVPIHRLGSAEEVYVVAETPKGLIYYEDVEEGFELGRLGTDGAIHSQGCNQYELSHVLAQLEL